ncbi:MAG: peptidylprolyl isomerase [Bacteroidales bacterium]|jgi:peptidyl-prolyl cis-trans isomerase SurA|nr:peptidylprolyl isomerase [Bacteroidales bacterium]
MKILKIGCIVLLLAINMTAQTQEAIAVDKVIAVVGKNMVKESELEVTYLQAVHQKSTSSDDEFTNKCDLLETMLLNKLLLHQAEVDTVNFTDAQVEQQFNALIQRNYGSLENCAKAMGKTPQEIKDKYMPETKNNMLMQSVVTNLTANLKLTPKEVTDFFNSIPKDSLPTIDEEYEFIQIVKHPIISQEDKDIIIQRLNGYRERISKGTKFSTLATLYSEDPGSAKKGGELGFFSRGQMVDEFETAAFALKTPGEVSPVIETKYGFHIIQLIERRGNQINVRHILIQAKPSDVALAKAKEDLDSIRNIIESGKISFEEAISVFSDDDSKINEGLIINPQTASTKFPKGNINKLMGNINNADFLSMKQGDITQPIAFESEGGTAYRLIKVRSKIESHKVNLHDDYDKIYNLASDQQRSNFIIDWANKKVKNTYVRLDPDYSQCKFKVNWAKQ